MKLGATWLALAGLLVACSSAIAQGQAPNTAQAAAATAAAATPPAVSAPPPTDRRRDAHADARKCLEFPTELQVIACAEKYRPPRRQ
jgi:guanyl-specific ribonuclease Sa